MLCTIHVPPMKPRYCYNTVRPMYVCTCPMIYLHRVFLYDSERGGGERETPRVRATARPVDTATAKVNYFGPRTIDRERSGVAYSSSAVDCLFSSTDTCDQATQQQYVDLR